MRSAIAPLLVVALVVAGCSQLEPGAVTRVDGVTWQDYVASIKAGIDAAEAKRDCISLRAAYDSADANDDVVMARTGHDNEMLKLYIDAAMQRLNCQT
jgi:hypothetical protein